MFYTSYTSPFRRGPVGSHVRVEICRIRNPCKRTSKIEKNSSVYPSIFCVTL